MIKLQEFILKTLNEENLTSQLEQLKEENIEIEEKPSNILFIEGPWGIGKTYYVKHILEKKLRDSNLNPITVSLFGLKSIKELKNKLINIYIKRKRTEAEVILKNFKSISLLFVILSILIILCNYIFEPQTICYEEIFSFNIQCYTYLPNILRIFNHLDYISKTYLCIIIIYFLLKKLFKTRTLITLISCLDNKYIGTGITLQDAEIYELFDAQKDILIFDDLERIITSELKFNVLYGFLNNLKENYKFNIILIGNKSESPLPSTTDKNTEKLEIQEIPCEYTKIRYQEIKENCLVNSSCNTSFLSTKIDYYLSKYLPNDDQVTIPDTSIVNLRKIRIAIISIKNIYNQLENEKVFDSTSDDLSKLNNFSDDGILEKSELEECIEQYIRFLLTGNIKSEYSMIPYLNKVRPDINFDINSFDIIRKSKINILLDISKYKDENYKKQYLLMINNLREKFSLDKVFDFININCKVLVNNINNENIKLLKDIIEFFLLKDFQSISNSIVHYFKTNNNVLDPLTDIFVNFCNSEKGKEELKKLRNSTNVLKNKIYEEIFNVFKNLSDS